MSKNKTQKVLIPKGTIDPDEDTLIEIPTELKEAPIVVAKKQDTTFTIESASKNVAFEGDKYSVSDDRNRTRSLKEHERVFSPRFHSSIRSLHEDEDDLSTAILNDTSRTENTVIERKFEDMQRAKKDLQQSAPFQTTITMGRLPDPSGQKSSSIGMNESLTTPKRSFLSTTVSCDKSLQCKSPKPRDDFSTATSQKRGDPPITNVLYQSCPASQDASLHSSAKRTDTNTSVSFRNCSSATLQDFEEDNFKSVSLKNKETSAACLSGQSKGDKESQSRCSKKERRSSDQTIPRKRKSKGSCNKCDLGLTDSQERLKKFYKCSDNALDEVYIEQLKRQFEEAKRKLEDAVMLASLSLKSLNSRKYSMLARSQATSSSSRAASICDSVPERDMSFAPLCGSKHSCVVFVPGPSKNPCRVLNQEEDSWPKMDSTVRDAYKNTEIYKNSLTKRPNEDYFRNQSPVQDNMADISASFVRSAKPPVRSLQSYRLTKDTNTQTGSNCSATKSKMAAQESSVQSSSSKCSRCCSEKLKNSSSVKYVKEPRCNFSDSESLVRKTSAFMK